MRIRKTRREKTYELTLHLQDIIHLFEEPDLTPFSDYYQPYSFKTGMDYIVGELYANPGVSKIKLTVILPPDRISPGLLEKTCRAIEKYSIAWMRDAEQEVAKIRYMGIRAAVAGVFGLVVIFSAAAWLENMTGFIQKVIANGLYVAGWVLIWFPFEALIYGIWEFSLERRAYQALRNIELHIQSE
jgi:hypothetical protein